MATVAPRLAERYEQEIRPALAQSLGRSNPHALPRMEKIVVSMGLGSAISDKKNLEDALAALSEITGQKASVCKARKSVANFKLRQGMAIGAKVTLRGARMYEFFDRLVALVLPRVRDFRGLSEKAFDGNGNYSLGLSEVLVFPELNPDKYQRSQGMNITICISGNSDDDSRELLKMFGFPFRRPDAENAA